MILVDSSVWIDFFSSSPGPAGRELRRMITESESFALAGLIVTEVLQGLARNVEPIEYFLGMWDRLEPHGLETFTYAASIFRLGRGKGVSLTTIDTLIATIALENDASVFTLDKDFLHIARLTGLDLYRIP